MSDTNPNLAADTHTARIAVVAVHGVGDTEPGSTVRAIGDLLLQFLPNSYRSLRETTLRIPVDRVEVPADYPSASTRRAFGLFHWHHAPRIGPRRSDPMPIPKSDG